MNPKIYFICPNNRHITGGVKQIYKQVEILNQSGIEAYVLHNKIGKKDKWFDYKNVPIKYSPYIFKKIKYLIQNKKIGIKENIILYFLKKISKKIDKNSILVFPEIYGDRINEIEYNIPKVIFNQGCYLTFNEFPIYTTLGNTPYTHKNTLAIITNSNNSKYYLNFCFPESKIFKIKLGINHLLFHFNKNKKKQICFMPRKLKEDTNQIINILRQRNNIKNWQFVSINNKSESEVANIMKESIIFLSINRCEGFGLPAAEAMACGCYVIGYHGQGGKEFFKPEFSTTIEDSNIIDFVKKIEETIDTYEKKSQEILRKGENASSFILTNYSLENEQNDTISVWNEILNLYKHKKEDK